jgi:hypothetical protein
LRFILRHCGVGKVRLIPQDLRALPAALFMKPVLSSPKGRRIWQVFRLFMSSSYMDTLKMSRRRFPHLADHKLETVTRHLLGKLPSGARRHRALDDAHGMACLEDKRRI